MENIRISRSEMKRRGAAAENARSFGEVVQGRRYTLRGVGRPLSLLLAEYLRAERLAQLLNRKRELPRFCSLNVSARQKQH